MGARNRPQMVGWNGMDISWAISQVPIRWRSIEIEHAWDGDGDGWLYGILNIEKKGAMSHKIRLRDARDGP